MDKLNNLKAHLLACVPGLKKSPEALHLFADEGRIVGDFENTLSYQYNWQTVLICENFNGHPDTLFLPLLAWLAKNQRDIKRDDIRFLLDPLDHDRADIRIEFPLDQRVIVTQDANGNYNTSHPAEPAPNWESSFASLTTTTGQDKFNG